VSPIDSDWDVVFGFAGDSTGVAANALSIVDDKSKIDHGKTSRVGDGVVTRRRTLILTQVHNIPLSHSVDSRFWVCELFAGLPTTFF
jgi:hypothetical protein